MKDSTDCEYQFRQWPLYYSGDLSVVVRHVLSRRGNDYPGLAIIRATSQLMSCIGYCLRKEQASTRSYCYVENTRFHRVTPKAESTLHDHAAVNKRHPRTIPVPTQSGLDACLNRQAYYTTHRSGQRSSYTRNTYG